MVKTNASECYSRSDVYFMHTYLCDPCQSSNGQKSLSLTLTVMSIKGAPSYRSILETGMGLRFVRELVVSILFSISAGSLWSKNRIPQLSCVRSLFLEARIRLSKSSHQPNKRFHTQFNVNKIPNRQPKIRPTILICFDTEKKTTTKEYQSYRYNHAKRKEYGPVFWGFSCRF